MRSAFIVSIAMAIALTGCGDGAENAGGASPQPTAAMSSAPKELGTLKASGFGQADEYVWATAVVHNNSDYVGQTVTVSFNVLDSAGEILATESQVESFSQPGADHVIGTQLSLEPGRKAAKVEAALDVEASGTFSDQPFPQLPTSNVNVTGKGAYRNVTFVLTNPLTVAVKDPRIQLACVDGEGAIIGGGSAYPELVPAGGQVKVDTDVIVSGEPKDCTVFVGAPADWEGAPAGQSASASPTTQAPVGTAEGAFKLWVEQFGKKNWKGQYRNLVGAQRKVISEHEYVACRNSESTPTLSWMKVLGVTDAGNTSIPGTKVSLPATKVSAQVKANGLKVPVDAHMYLEDGAWKWSMTKENIANCSN
jgi:hypothetical protein